MSFTLTTAGEGTWTLATDLGLIWLARWHSKTPSLNASDKLSGKLLFNRDEIVCKTDSEYKSTCNKYTVLILITAHIPIRAESSNFVVFRLQPVFIYHLLYKCICCWYSLELPRLVFIKKSRKKKQKKKQKNTKTSYKHYYISHLLILFFECTFIGGYKFSQ